MTGWTRAMVILAALAVGVAASACSPGAQAADGTQPRVGIVFDIGGKDDRSFNAAAWAGVKCAESGMLPDQSASCGRPPLGVTVRDVEPGTPTNIEPAMRAFADVVRACDVSPPAAACLDSTTVVKVVVVWFTSVQPEGVVTVTDALNAATITSMSPATTDAGMVTVCAVPAVLVVEVAVPWTTGAAT